MAMVKGGKSGDTAEKIITPEGKRVFKLKDGSTISDEEYKAKEGDYTEAVTGPQGSYTNRAVDSSGTGITSDYKPDRYSNSTPTPAPTGGPKMSPLEKAAFESKQRKAGTPTPVPSPIDDEEKKKKRNNNQLSALMGSDEDDA